MKKLLWLIRIDRTICQDKTRQKSPKMKKSHPLRIFEIKLTVNKNLKSPSYRHFSPRSRPQEFSFRPIKLSYCMDMSGHWWRTTELKLADMNCDSNGLSPTRMSPSSDGQGIHKSRGPSSLRKLGLPCPGTSGTSRPPRGITKTMSADLWKYSVSTRA